MMLFAYVFVCVCCCCCCCCHGDPSVCIACADGNYRNTPTSCAPCPENSDSTEPVNICPCNEGFVRMNPNNPSEACDGKWYHKQLYSFTYVTFNPAKTFSAKLLIVVLWSFQYRKTFFPSFIQFLWASSTELHKIGNAANNTDQFCAGWSSKNHNCA